MFFSLSCLLLVMNIGQARREFGWYGYGKIQQVERKRLAMCVEIQRVVDATVQHAFDHEVERCDRGNGVACDARRPPRGKPFAHGVFRKLDRKSTRLNSSHVRI